MAEALSGVTSPAWDARRLAIGLGLAPDARQAAQLVGLRVDGSYLRELEREARASHRGLIDGDQAELNKIANAIMMLASIRMAATVDAFRPAHLTKAISTMAQSLQALQGSARPVFGTINVTIEAPGQQAPTS